MRWSSLRVLNCSASGAPDSLEVPLLLASPSPLSIRHVAVAPFSPLRPPLPPWPVPGRTHGIPGEGEVGWVRVGHNSRKHGQRGAR